MLVLQLVVTWCISTIGTGTGCISVAAFQQLGLGSPHPPLVSALVFRMIPIERVGRLAEQRIEGREGRHNAVLLVCSPIERIERKWMFFFGARPFDEQVKSIKYR